MAQKINRLAVAELKHLGPGMHADGAGLYAQITRGKHGRLRKSWLFRYTANGRERWAGLGSFDDVGLADARKKADVYRRQVSVGTDPLAVKEAEKVKAKIDAAKAATFDQCAQAYIEAHKTGWRNATHRQQWTNTLDTYATPVFGSLPVASISTALVLKVLQPVWSKKPETASRVRQRIESILDYAKVSGYREGENPARWRGHLDELLPARAKVRRVKHHAAMPYTEIGTFMADLRARASVSALALEFTIMTAARTEETIGAPWPEFDLNAKVWTVPAERMKAGREHRVPLSDAAVAVLKRMIDFREDDDGHVFPGALTRRGLSNMAMLELLRGMRPGLTVHGFRSTFRDWAAERTSFASEVVEKALAHTVDNKVEAAYRRGDLFEKRRRLMIAWAEFCAKPASRATVTPIRAQAAE